MRRCDVSHTFRNINSVVDSIHQAELSATSLVEIVQGVVGGGDGCIFSYGHARLGEWRDVLLVDAWVCFIASLH